MAIVVVIRPLDDKMRDWWVMASLLEVDFRPILAIGLMSLTKNRVQWLLKNFVVVGL